MKTMMLIDGDLVISRRDYMPVSGTGKIAQDLRAALLEPMGNDRFHTGWGSVLNDYVAQIADENTRMQVEAEVNRVVTNYAAVQQDKIDSDIASESEPTFTTSDILSRIEEIRVDTTGDSVQVGIRLQAASGETIVLAEAVA